MTYKVLVLLSRKPDTTPEAFKSYYNDHHLPMYRSLVGDLFPLLHTQRYIHRTASSSSMTTTPSEGTTTRNPTTPATLLRGTQSDVDFDVEVTLEFKDAQAWQAQLDLLQRPDINAMIVADEERFLDRGKTVAVLLGEVIELRAKV
ncbi:EthD domain-containing protein [Xylaria sp. CBS 124048]|nr:EthD domain-containing protein [Xylaria sp. CBS 124048]